MTDLVRAEPETLEAYTDTATAAGYAMEGDIENYRTAWISFTTAQFYPPVEPPLSKDADIIALVNRVVYLDRLPTALALALRTLDTNSDGALSEADGILVNEHPQLLAYLYPEGTGGGDTAVNVLLSYFDDLDNADDGGDLDGKVSTNDLEAAANDPNAPFELQAAAQYLLDNPSLLTLVDTGADTDGPGAADGEITLPDIETFLQTNEHLRNLVGYEGQLDIAGEGGEPDGEVSTDDLEAAAADTSLPEAVRSAAQFLLDNDAARRSIDRGLDGWHPGTDNFSEQLAGRLINGQAYVDDPEAAAGFVSTLPVPEDGDHGIPIELVGDDGFMALANGALTETQQVISHLPETTSALRNELITSFYDMLGQRADTIFADGVGATPGDPTSPGHPGVNWLLFAPWASNGVHDVITGEFSVWGINPTMGARQGAADGNQWIFDDITSRYASFVELYEASGGQPTSEQLERFFADNFDDGDLQIRTGFQAYVAALNEPDPAVRQQLMFQANTLVATHEQAGADPYLDQVSLGPDGEATKYIDVQMGDHLIEVNEDIDSMANESNLVDDVPILGLDPVGLGNEDLSGNGVTFGPGGVNLEDISGWGDTFDVSTAQWFEEGGGTTERIWVGTLPPIPVDVAVTVDPDQSLEGTGADSWPDYEDRMWNLTRLFEQLHTDPSLYDTSEVRGSLDLNWLDTEVRDSVMR